MAKLNSEFYWDWVNHDVPAELPGVWLCRPEGAGGPWLEVRPNPRSGLWEVYWQDTLGRRPGVGGLRIAPAQKSPQQAKMHAVRVYNLKRG